MASAAGSNHSTGSTSQADTVAGVSSSEIHWKKKILSNIPTSTTKESELKNLENLGLLPSTCQYRKTQNEEFLTDNPQQIEAPPILDIEAAEGDAQTSGNPKDVSGLQESVKDFRTLEDSAKMLQAAVVDGDADEDNAQSGRNPEEISHVDIDADGDDAQTGTSHKEVSSKEISAKAEKRTLASDPDASSEAKKLKMSISEQSIPIEIETIATMVKGLEKEWREAKTRDQECQLMIRVLEEKNQVLHDTLKANEHKQYRETLNQLKLEEQLQAKKAELSRLEAKLRDWENHCSDVESKSQEAAIDTATHAIVVIKSWNPSLDVRSLLKIDSHSRNEFETIYSTLSSELGPDMRRFVRSLFKNEGFTN